jgi:hypothetical protein
MNFVIQYHQTNKDHYDLMLEQETHLLTWQIAEKQMNLLLDGETILVTKIQDHRKKYLSYEGPISCDRGHVTIYDSGVYSVLLWTNNVYKINMQGNKLKGVLNIQYKEKDLYLVTFNN